MKKSDDKVIGFVDKSVKMAPQKHGVHREKNVLLGATEITRALINCAASGIYMVQKGKFIYISPLFSQITGYSEQDILGKYSLNLVHPDDREFVRQNAIASLKGLRAEPYEYRFIRKDGRLIWILEKVVSAEIKGKRVTVGSFMDITDLKKWQESSLTGAGFDTRILDVSPNPIVIFGMDGSIKYVNRALEELSGYSVGELIGKKPPFPYWTEQDLGKVSSIFELAITRGISRHEVRFRKKDGTEFWVQLNTGRINENTIMSTWVDISERKLAEQELFKTKSRLEYLLSATPAVIYATTPSTEYAKYMSKNVEKLLGYKPEDFTNNPNFWESNIHPDDVARVKDEMKILKQQDYLAQEYRFRRSDGTYIWLFDEMNITRDSNGNAVELIGYWIDITDKKIAQFEAEKERDRAQKYLDIVDVILLVLDADGKVSLINNKGCEVLGYSEEGILGKDWFNNFIPSRMRDEVRQVFNKLISGHFEPFRHFENPIITIDGNERLIAWNNTVIQDNDGKVIGVLSSGDDVTERKRASDLLKESEMKYKAITENSLTGIYIVQDGKLVYFNKKFAEMHGYQQDELVGKDFLSLVHPDFREYIHECIGYVLAGNEEARVGEVRKVKKDGSTIWCQYRASVIEYQGKPAILCNVIDITERKRMEEELSLRAEILDEATDSIIVHDLVGNIVYVNATACKEHGYSRDEMLKMKIVELVAPEQKWIVKDRFQELMDKKYIVLEFDDMRKDGTRIPMEVHTRLISSASGEFIISVARNISERKRAEEELVYLATHDHLTGLPNRGLLNDRMNLALAQAERNQYKLAVMMLDLDKFKNVNDEFGHSMGDKLLKQVGERLVKTLRKTDTIARIGGDEFLVLLPGIKKMENINRIAVKIIKSFQEPFLIDGHKLNITTSIGIAIYPDDGADSDDLVKKADKSMYCAKEKGRNTYMVYAQLGLGI